LSQRQNRAPQAGILTALLGLVLVAAPAEASPGPGPRVEPPSSPSPLSSGGLTAAPKRWFRVTVRESSWNEAELVAEPPQVPGVLDLRVSGVSDQVLGSLVLVGLGSTPEGEGQLLPSGDALLLGSPLVTLSRGVELHQLKITDLAGLRGSSFSLQAVVFDSEGTHWTNALDVVVPGPGSPSGQRGASSTSAR